MFTGDVSKSSEPRENKYNQSFASHIHASCTDRRYRKLQRVSAKIFTHELDYVRLVKRKRMQTVAILAMLSSRQRAFIEKMSFNLSDSDVGRGS